MQVSHSYPTHHAFFPRHARACRCNLYFTPIILRQEVGETSRTRWYEHENYFPETSPRESSMRLHLLFRSLPRRVNKTFPCKHCAESEFQIAPRIFSEDYNDYSRLIYFLYPRSYLQIFLQHLSRIARRKGTIFSCSFLSIFTEEVSGFILYVPVYPVYWNIFKTSLVRTAYDKQ